MEKYYCYEHDEVEFPVYSINIEFEDKEDWNEITDLDTEDEVVDYIKTTIELQFPNEKIKDYSYCLCCPECLQSVE